MAAPSPDLQKFGHADAWRIGTALVEHCVRSNLSLVVSIWLGEQLVFTAALEGTSADSNSWAHRKAAVVRRFNRSSQEIWEQHLSTNRDFYQQFGLSSEQYAAVGGAVPIRVRGTMVGVLAVSGLASEDDHELAVHALEERFVRT